MVFDAKTYNGFKLQYADPATGTEARKIKGDGSSVLNIYYDRQEDYPFIIRTRVETAASGIANRGKPADDPSRVYEVTWVSDADFITESYEIWSGIYGAPFIVFDTPFGNRSKEIVYVRTDPTTGKVDPEHQENWPQYIKDYWNAYSGPDPKYGTNAHFYQVGERSQYVGSTEYPGMGVCDVTYNRPDNWPYYVRYHRQKVTLDGWEENSQLMQFTDSMNAEVKTIVDGGTLVNEYDFKNNTRKTENIPNPSGDAITWENYLMGFNYNSSFPTNGKLTTDS